MSKIKSPIGTQISCKGWHQEAAYRMIQNNLDSNVAEDPDNLIVYGGYGKAARDWKSYDKTIYKNTLRLYAIYRDMGNSSLIHNYIISDFTANESFPIHGPIATFIFSTLEPFI